MLTHNNLYEASLGQESEEPIELTIEEYEEQKAHHQMVLEMGEAAHRLASNEDFKMLVVQGYLTDEPKRLAELMASGRLHKTNLDDCKDNLRSIGDFRQFMRRFLEDGAQAAEELKMLEEARDEAIKAEEAAAS